MQEAVSSKLRGMARRVLRGVVYVRPLPPEFGGIALYVSPESQLKYLRPGRAGFDPMLLAWAREFPMPNRTVWDIGANVGVFSFAAAAMGASVLAVEPDPFLGYLLMRSCAIPRNRSLKIRIVQGAISDKSGFAKLIISAEGRAANSLAQYSESRREYGVAAGEVMVPTTSLDSLLDISDAPALIKIDTEGSEREVIAGATRLLDVVRPTWIFEAGKEHWSHLAEIFRSKRYRLFNANGSRTEEIHSTAFNTLAVPE